MDSPLPFGDLAGLLINVFIALAMLCIGLSATLREMTASVRKPDQLLRVLAANVLIPPIIALLLIGLLPLQRPVAIVLFLLALAPGGINAVQFSTKAQGQNAAAGALLILLSVIGLILAPAAAKLIIPVDAFARIAWDLLVLRIAGVIAVPLIAGILIRRFGPETAEKIYKPAMIVSTLSFIGSVILSFGLRQGAVAELGAISLLAMAIFIVSLMLTGWGFGRNDPEFRQVLAVCTNLRNVGLVYLLVDACCVNPLYSASVLAFMALMVPCNLVLTVLCAIARKRRTRKAGDDAGSTA